MTQKGYIPEVLDTPRMPRAPRVELPQNSCDTHCHVFGPYEQYPLQQPSSYAPPDAPAPRYLQMLDTVGMTRGVLVQPAPYGTDSSALVDAIAVRKHALRGVAVASADASVDELQRLHKAGIRGLRFVEARDPKGNLFAGSVGFETIDILAPAMRQAGLHVQMWGPYDTYLNHLERLADLDLPLVIDHMASLVPARGVEDPIFKLVCKLLKRGKLWMKLSVCRVSRNSPDYADVRPFHDALLSANVDRLLWGSDWPYVRMGESAPDVGELVELAYEWMGDEQTRKKIWVDNPQMLYGFESTRG
ncbi:2-pyrone-4,6-dicarboxylate hydrolase [Pollutimonas nitritireducens]|uniref:2-pyrone-4,6-dicarboxylate hydrolase n=1 Tax=Pollutimonas nitritireducens TaxID=2045209 RepID=A0A2N4UAT9_9BURK|nr:amidohydrolase family protein [Pollutimonas nitritireducens]PLC52136.1 2-pyrone-4,6-dicarboxylate hydrolase [Pollutimonas nitritireducens]